MQDTINFLQKLLSATLGISLTKIPFQKSSMFTFLQNKTNYVFDFFFSEKQTFWQQISQAVHQNDIICEFLMPGDIVFFICIHKETDTAFVLGPALTQPFSRTDSLHSLDQYRIPPQVKEDIVQLCSTIATVDNSVLHHTAELVFNYLTHAEPLFKSIHANILPQADSSLMHHSLSSGENIAQIRQIEQRYEYSAALTDVIKQGNLSLAMHMVSNYNPATQTAIRNANPLRNAQNYCIVLNTQLRHALEETSIHPYQVDKLSNEIGLEIEQLKSIAQLSDFFRSIIRRYCRLVQEHTHPNLKPLTKLAVTYIKENLADNLTVKDTAKALTVNANYLSSLFRRDMGMTFIDFVNQERTSQAASLLKHTNLQIQQIASAVGYNNTSYFAKQFVRFHGLSPSHYRESAH